MAKKPIDITSLPEGLTKKEFIMAPEMKSIKSWFIWAGWVQILTGIANFATVGELAQLQARGYIVDEKYMMLLVVISLFFIALGIALLVSKSTTVAYIVGITGIAFALYAISTGGSVGGGIIATVFAVISAVKADNAWKQYLSRN